MSTESKALGKGISAGWVKWLVVTLVLGVLAFLTSPIAPLGGFWGAQAERAAPAGVQMLLFILLSAIQSIAFGLGIAFLIFSGECQNACQPGLGTSRPSRNCMVALQLVAAQQLSPVPQLGQSQRLTGY
jgi:hypothetical protein